MKYLTFTDHNYITGIRALRPSISYITELLITGTEEHILCNEEDEDTTWGLMSYSTVIALRDSFCSDWIAFSKQTKRVVMF